MHLDGRGIGFKSLTQHIDTTTHSGIFVFQIVRALAEPERYRIRECTNTGLSAARARSRKGGRPPVNAFRNPATLAMAQHRYYGTDTSIDAICGWPGICRSTRYRYVGTKRTAATTRPSRDQRQLRRMSLRMYRRLPVKVAPVCSAA
jgi:hypothetical protein